jgi:hypothetical protein
MPAKKGHKMPQMIGNKNAEKWGLRKSTAFYQQALALSFDVKFDFLGEIAKEMGSYIDIFDYLADKFPKLQHLKNHIKRNCEANCFSNAKKGKIKEASAIVNLKSNHGWIDRQRITGEFDLNIEKMTDVELDRVISRLLKAKQ